MIVFLSGFAQNRWQVFIKAGLQLMHCVIPKPNIFSNIFQDWLSVIISAGTPAVGPGFRTRG